MDANGFVYRVKALNATLIFETQEPPTGETLDELARSLRDQYAEFGEAVSKKNPEAMDQTEFEKWRAAKKA